MNASPRSPSAVDSTTDWVPRATLRASLGKSACGWSHSSKWVARVTGATSTAVGVVPIPVQSFSRSTHRTFIMKTCEKR
jgi:hypothetical protein